MSDPVIKAKLFMFTPLSNGRFPFRLKVVDSNHRHGVCTELLMWMREWCDEHLGRDEWARNLWIDGETISMTVFAFRNDSARILFKMRWG